MAAQSNIVLADGQGTPVAHTFEPNGSYKQVGGAKQGVPPVVSTWIDRLGHALEIGRMELREDQRPSVGPSKARIRTVLTIPIVEAVDGKNVVVRTHVFDMEARFDPGATQVERDNVAALVKNFTASTYFQSKVKTGEFTW